MYVEPSKFFLSCESDPIRGAGRRHIKVLNRETFAQKYDEVVYVPQDVYIFSRLVRFPVCFAVSRFHTRYRIMNLPTAGGKVTNSMYVEVAPIKFTSIYASSSSSFFLLPRYLQSTKYNCMSRMNEKEKKNRQIWINFTKVSLTQPV